MKVKVDFHVHTIYSPDSVITFQDLRDGCREKGIDVVAIMDHDVIEGAFEFAARSEELLSRGEWAPRVLVGEEVRTTKGEICGLFLSRWVPDHRPPRETMEFIREQGGLLSATSSGALPPRSRSPSSRAGCIGQSRNTTCFPVLRLRQLFPVLGVPLLYLRVLKRKYPCSQNRRVPGATYRHRCNRYSRRHLDNGEEGVNPAGHP